MLDKQHVTPCMIEDVLEHDKTARQGYYVIQDYRCTPCRCSSTPTCERGEQVRDPHAPDEAEPEADAQATRLASERMPAPGQPHEEPSCTRRRQARAVARIVARVEEGGGGVD